MSELRYTSDGALAECPCCGSLDVGGAHDTVNCYGCGLNIKAPRPLQNAINAWNRRASHATPAEDRDGLDARRYRWAKRRAYKDGVTLSLEIAVIDDIAIGDFGEFIDAAIDAALATQGEKNG